MDVAQIEGILATIGFVLGLAAIVALIARAVGG